MAVLFAVTARAAEGRYIVVLEGKPLAAPAEAGGRAAAPASADRRARIAREQDAVAAWVEGTGGRVLERFQLLNHALSVELSPEDAGRLRAQPGVAGVHPERHYRRSLAQSVPFIGAGRSWSGQNGVAGVTGKGMRIGIIDSGIDYTHAMFGGKGTVAAYNGNDPARIEAGTFPTAKVVGGTDFVGDNYDSSGISGSSTPVPDPDPLDPSGTGHGSHVAGIAAGFGVLAGGATFRGPYTATLDPAQFQIGPGVAPEASLYALKIFGASGSTSSSMIIKALHWAGDPNGDGNTSDHLDVVNLSLGSDFADHTSGDPERDAVDLLVQSGCVVVIAAGNGGDTAYKVSSPSTAPRAISVANSTDTIAFATAVQVTAPPSVAGKYDMVEGAFSKPLSQLPAIHAAVAMAKPALVCGPLSNASELAGKIALIDRGTCNFEDKVRVVQDAGAVGAIVANNVDGPPFTMAGAGGIPALIPAVMISKADGDRLKTALAAGLEATLSADATNVHTELADNVDPSSSRGPTYARAALKPDMAAPGASITSASAGQGAAGISYTGTSMATPHLAGAAALVRQAHPGWTAEDIKAVLMNTAVTPMRDAKGHPYGESRVGAGRVAVDRALASPITVRAENDGGAVSLSFGQILAGGPVTRPGVFVVSNHGGTAVTLSVVSSNTLANPGVVLVPSVAQVTVPANGTARVGVELRVTPALLREDADDTSAATIGGYPRFAVPEGSGELWFLGGPVDVHVPWYSVVRAASQQASPTRLAGTPAGDVVTLGIPTRGASGHARPLVGVFQFGTPSIAEHFNDQRDVTDLVAVGAATDYASARSVVDAYLYFAVVTAAAWATPQRYFHDFEIEIDLDGDGFADRVLLNNNEGSASRGDPEDYQAANDAFVTGIDFLDGFGIEIAGIANGLSPAVADTAPFQNAMLVHAVTGAQLGLTPGSPAFRYRGSTTGSFSDATASWIRFDPTRPVVDGTPFGIRNTPWQDEGPNVRANVSRPNAGAAGISQNGQVAVLLVHAQGLPGLQSEIVRFNLGTADIDGDGLPDAWEMANLGDLASTGAADRDGDGFTDAQEFAAGTNPADAGSRLMLVPPVQAGPALAWVSVAGKRYSVLRADAVGGPYAPVRSGIVATAATSSFVDPELPGATHPYFYRVQLDP